LPICGVEMASYGVAKYANIVVMPYNVHAVGADLRVCPFAVKFAYAVANVAKNHGEICGYYGKIGEHRGEICEYCRKKGRHAGLPLRRKHYMVNFRHLAKFFLYLC